MPSFAKVTHPLLLFVVATVPMSQAGTITVDSTATSVAVDGHVTLSEAIMSVNAGSSVNTDVQAAGIYGSGDTIQFAIPGNGLHTIMVTTPLPVITRPVTIDGYTQPGSSPNNLVVGDDAVIAIELSGDGSPTSGLFLISPLGGSTIRGLVINRFGHPGIEIENSSGNTISGNFIGTDATGTLAAPNGANGTGGEDSGGIRLEFASTNNLIGGTSPADRNIISSNFGEEIFLDDVTGAGTNRILANYIGVAADGRTYLTGISTKAIRIFNSSHTVIGGTTGTTPGGPCTGACNVVLGDWAAVYIEGSDTTTDSVDTNVQGNFFGLNAAGDGVLGSQTAAGVVVFHVGGGVTIGGTTASARNLFAGTEWGVFIANGDRTSVRGQLSTGHEILRLTH